MQVGEDRFNKEEINRLYDEMIMSILSEPAVAGYSAKKSSISSTIMQ
jgi:hypothetical protein